VIELEIMLNDLSKLYEKEKGIRNRVLLEKAIDSLKDYETAKSTVLENTYLIKKQR